MIRLLLLISLLPFSGINAQYNARNISGVVKSSTELTPLEGVTVTIKGTKRISGTQPDGVFYIDVESQDSVVVFSYRGFETKEIRLTGANDYSVILKKLEGEQFYDFAVKLLFRRPPELLKPL